MYVNTFIASCNTTMKGPPDYKVTLPVHATATTNKVLKEQISMFY